MKIDIALGSFGPIKAEATEIARRNLRLEGDMTIGSVASGVNPEPNGPEETERGARNRAREMRKRRPDAWALGIENGIMRSGSGWIDVAAIVLIGPDGQEWLSWSDALPLPPEDVAVALERGPHVTIGEIISERTGCDPLDPHRHLTGRSRIHFLSEAIEKLFRFVLGNRLNPKETP